MALETGTYISDLVSTNPTSSDGKNQGDDHIRLLKSTIKATFPNVSNVVLPTHTELNYVDGVTSAIQTQLDAKAPLASPSFTGTPTVPTASVGTTGTQAASLDFVIATSLAGTLPGQTGNSGKFLSTDGTNGFWQNQLNGSVVTLASGGSIVGTTETQTLKAKTLETPALQDSSDATKKANLILSSVTAGQNRNITIGDENMTLFTPSERLLGVITASDSATIDIEGYFTSTYDDYKITLTDFSQATASTRAIQIRFKKAGAYITTNYRYLSHGGSLTSGVNQIQAINNTAIDSNPDQVWLEVLISKPLDTAKEHMVMMRGSGSACSNPSNYCGANSTTGALQGIRFFLNSGNIKTGTFKIFGIRKT